MLSGGAVTGLANAARAAAAFYRARWRLRHADRAALEREQHERLARFLERDLPRFPFYADFRGARLDALPIVDKARVLGDFAAFNSRGITLAAARAVAERSAARRDFSETLPDGIVVGLSSGTSGAPGVFLVSAAERALWAGVVLGKLLESASLRRVADPRRSPLRVALFLRADSRLYSTVTSPRLELDFFDLLRPLPALVDALQAFAPDILIAPGSVLGELAQAQLDARLRIAPQQVVNAAEVLEAADASRVVAVWSRPAAQIYQACEGFLGASCEHGRIHLNEEFVHVEPQWLDAERRRFTPIVTDFSRRTQAVVRYRLDDVLVAAASECDCGRPTRAIDAVDGRADEILWLRARAGGALAPVFADSVRHAMALAATPADVDADWQIEQHGDELRVQLAVDGADTRAGVQHELARLCDGLGVTSPALRFDGWVPRVAGDKRRRLLCRTRPGPGLAGAA